MKRTKEAGDAAGWTSVPGVVEQSEAIEAVGWQDPDTGKPVMVWQWRLMYSFPWQGAARHGTRYSLEDPMRARARSGLDRYLQRFPAGAPVEVWVNPAQPEQTVLDRSTPRRLQRVAIALAAAGLVLACIAFQLR